jgi:NAD(P)-dependent dehydrogenase (short-subunit alcohol dehydrogenase family)
MGEKPGVLVTGAADGIGWATAELFAARGWRVAIADIDEDAARRRANELGEGHLGLGVDVADEAAVVACAETMRERFGGCDALVNNAGIGDTHLPTLEQKLADFRRVVDVHLQGTYLMSREIGRLMVAAGAGAIVNTSSIAGLGGMARRNAYGAAKAGIVSLTRAMACEWARHGVRVNAVAPGYVGTHLVRQLASAGRIDIAGIRKRVPMGRLGEPKDIAEAVVFLASPAASFITGAVLSVDGGWTAFGDFGDASPE